MYTYTTTYEKTHTPGNSQQNNKIPNIKKDNLLAKASKQMDTEKI